MPESNVMSPLPPVSPGKLGGRPMGAPQTAAKPGQPAVLKAEKADAADHPFDTPFSIIKTMQAELIRLKEEMQREQHERKVEVSSLKRDLGDLKEQVRKGEAKQQNDHTVMTKTVKDLQIKEQEDWTTTRKEMEAEFAVRCMCAQHEALAARVEGNYKGLQTTNEFIQKQITTLQMQIQANAEGDNEFAQEMKSELNSQRRQIDVNTVNDEEFARNVLSRMRAAGQFLRAAGAPALDKATFPAAKPSPRQRPDELGTTARRALGSLMTNDFGAYGVTQAALNAKPAIGE